MVLSAGLVHGKSLPPELTALKLTIFALECANNKSIFWALAAAAPLGVVEEALAHCSEVDEELPPFSKPAPRRTGTDATRLGPRGPGVNFRWEGDDICIIVG